MTTLTVQLPLRHPSNRKQKRIQSIMQRQNRIAQRIANLMPSIPRYRWGNTRQDPVYHRWIHKEFPDNLGLRSHDANQVAYKVAENFQSWRTNKGRNRPQYDNATWARFCNCNPSLKYEQNDGKWGARLPFEPYNPEWFRLRTGQYQEQFLEQATAGDATLGDAELKDYNGTYVLNQTITLPAKTNTDYEPATRISVHLGLNNLATTAVKHGDTISDVELYSGGEARHYRRRMREMRTSLQETNNHEKIHELRDLEHRYINNVNHTLSRRIVDTATDHDQPLIVLEDLKGIRERLNENKKQARQRAALNSWQFHALRTMIEYKAEKEGIQTTTVVPENVSRECNKCGTLTDNPDNDAPSTEYTEFYCPGCDYRVHTDVNAAINLLQND